MSATPEDISSKLKAIQNTFPTGTRKINAGLAKHLGTALSELGINFTPNTAEPVLASWDLTSPRNKLVGLKLEQTFTATRKVPKLDGSGQIYVASTEVRCLYARLLPSATQPAAEIDLERIDFSDSSNRKRTGRLLVGKEIFPERPSRLELISLLADCVLASTKQDLQPVEGTSGWPKPVF